MPVALVFAILSIVLLIYVAAPLLGVREQWQEVFDEDFSLTPKELKMVKEEKQAYLRAIKDVDYEYALGKLSKEDYEELRNYYMKRAALIISALEELESEADREGVRARN